MLLVNNCGLPVVNVHSINAILTAKPFLITVLFYIYSEDKEPGQGYGSISQKKTVDEV
jgi:hypothetical protein